MTTDNRTNEQLAERLRQFAESQAMDFDNPHTAMMLNEVADRLTAAPAETVPKQYAPCFVNGNGTLSILGTVNKVREYAENKLKMLQDNEAAYPDGNPDAIILGSRVVTPWLPVPGGEGEER